MARLGVGALAVEVDLVVFDKDGTLVDFHGVWGARARRAVAALEPVLGLGRGRWREALFATLGFDPGSGRIDGAGLLASQPHAIIEQCCLQTLVAQGVEVEVAGRALRERFAPVMRAPPEAGASVAIAGAAALLEELVAAGVRCAVLTTDDRAATEAAARDLGIRQYLSAMVCGDDALAPKPAPAGILQIASSLGVAPARSVMVGDTPLDLRAGRAAGCACVAGVTSGACSADLLAPLADVVLESVRAVRVSA